MSSLSDEESDGVGEDTQRCHIIPVARETIFLLSGHALSSSDQVEAQCSPCCDSGKENKQKGEKANKGKQIGLFKCSIN